MAPNCPQPFSLVGGHCFWMSQSLHTFESCQRDVCGPKGAALACVRQAESERLAWRIGLGTTSDDFLPVWIGYSDAAGSWSWMNGCQSTWTNWLPGDPDSYCGAEDCAAITPGRGRWTDLSCRMRLPCLCEHGLQVTAAYNMSIAALRDDTCYVECGGHARWCSAWPFPWLYKEDEDLCRWEQKDGQRRGRGVQECVTRAAATAGCGNYTSYAVGMCSCSPATGRHADCAQREADAAWDVFKLTPAGAQLVHPGQRCAYTTTVDDTYFASLRPASKPRELVRLWARAAAAWLAVGVPCTLVMGLVGCSVCATCPCRPRGLEHTFSAQQWAGGSGGGVVYGPLIDSAADAGASDAVHRWILRGASGAIVYGMALLVLGGALAAHMAGQRFSFGVELMASMVMAFSKAAVARAAFMVHNRLAPTAREVAGLWVLVVAVAKLLMAVTAFGGGLIFGTLADEDYENICFAEYLFRWACLLAMPLQSVAGLAFWRLHMRSAEYAGGASHFGGLALLLVLGNFASGAGVWFGGYLDAVHRLGPSVAGCFVAAAAGQLVAGVVLLQLNHRVQQHFARAEGGREGGVPATQLGRIDAEDLK